MTFTQAGKKTAVVTASAARRIFRAIFYGEPGGGKTRLACAYPKTWGRAAYIGFDQESERLDSVMEADRPFIDPIAISADDPITALAEVAVHPWKKEGYGVLIVDTVSKQAKRILAYSAKKGYFAGKDGDKHVQFGPKDSPIAQAIPAMGDYRGTQAMLENWLQELFDNQEGMHIILVMHEELDIPDEKAPSDAKTFGGPATVGRAGLRWFPSEFPVVIRVVPSSTTDLGGKTVTKYRAISEKRGAFIARIRENREKGNPMPVVDLDPTARNWYTEFQKHFMAEEVTSG